MKGRTFYKILAAILLLTPLPFMAEAAGSVENGAADADTLLAEQSAPGATAALPSSVSRDSILIGDQIRWSLRWDMAEGEIFYIDPLPEAPSEGVELIRQWDVDTLRNRRGAMQIEASAIVTSFDSGSFALPPVSVGIRRADGTLDTLRFQGHAIEVDTIPIDMESFEPYDIKGQAAFPLTLREVAIPTGIILLLAAAILAVLRYIKMRRENRGFFGQGKEVDPPHITALREIEKIRGQKLWQGDRQKQYYTALTDALRRYAADVYGIPAMEQTSGELFGDLEERVLDKEVLERLRELFTTADFVKFAKHSASPAENEEAIPVAIKFVNTTYMEQVAAAEADRSESTEEE